MSDRGPTTWILVIILAALSLPPVHAQDADKRGLAPIVNESPAPSEAGYTGHHALIIGVDDHQDPAFPDLGYAAADARGIAKLLVEHLKFEEDRVRLVLNEDATKADLERELVD